MKTGEMKQNLIFLAVGFFSLIASVYVSSFWLRPAKSAVPMVIAQAPQPPAPAVVPGSVTPVSAAESTAPQVVMPANILDPAPAFLEPYLYDMREGRRNPFKAASLIEAGSLTNPMAGPSTPLERFEIDELKLLAIIWDVKNPRAMFLDPTSIVHTVAKDDRIGRRRGYVAVIREGEVVVVESSSYGGEAVYSTRILRIER